MLLTVLVYARALSGELVYDDLLLIGRNPLLSDLRHVPELFTRPYWDFLGPGNAEQIGYWRPLTATVQALAFAAGDGATPAFHAFEIAIHAGATALALALALRLTADLRVAVAAALVFGLHPVHVESVAWISALNDPLFGLCALASLCAWLGWRARGSRGIPWLALVAFALALLAKELAIAVLPLCAVADLGRRKTPDEAPGPAGRFRRPHAAYGSFVLVFLLYYLARVAVFGSPWAGFDRTTTDFRVDAARLALLRVEILGGALELLAWPARLNVFRSFDPSLGFADGPALAALGWCAAALALGLFLWRKGARAGLAALLVVPAGLLPVLVRVESLGRFPLSDRFLYVPVLGAGLGLGLVAFRALPERLGWALVALVVAVCGWRSYERIGVWHDEETLFTNAARETPQSPYVLWGLGRVLLERYRAENDVSDLQRAAAVYDAAQELLVQSRAPDPRIFVSSNDFMQVNLGYAWCRLLLDQHEGFTSSGVAARLFEDLAEAIQRIDNEEAEARALGIRVQSQHLELEQVYTGLGVAHMFAGRLDTAEDALKRALQINKEYPEAHLSLGRLYAVRGRWDLARLHFERALAQRPEHFESKLLLAQAEFSAGALDRAAALARELTARDPTRAEPWVVLATRELAGGKPREALRWLDRALDADPSYGFAWYHRAKALLLSGESEEARFAFSRAVALLPENFEANYDAGVFLANTGNLEAARPLLVRAYVLCRDPALLERLRDALLRLVVTADGLLELAQADAARGASEQALAWADAAFAQAPERSAAVLARARLLRRLGRDEEALSAFARALELEPPSFAVWSEYGKYLAELDRDAEARPWLTRALELPPPPEWDAELVRTARESILRALEGLEAQAPDGGG